MPAKDDVIALAEAEARQNEVYWWCGGPGAVFTWSMGNSQFDRSECGKDRNIPFSCSEFPLLCALRSGAITRQQVNAITPRYMGVNQSQAKKDNNKQSGLFSKYGYSISVWKDWPSYPKNRWRPQRGDLVFFSTGGTASDCEHVAIACGTFTSANHAEVISFGDLQLDHAGPTRRSKVHKTTIEALKLTYNSKFVKFCNPIWG